MEISGELPGCDTARQCVVDFNSGSRTVVRAQANTNFLDVDPMTALPNLAVIHGKSTGAKDERGRFVSGPANTGRPVGARNRQSAELMKIVRAMGNRAAANLSDALDAKEQWATTLVLRYCLPSSRTQEMHGADPEDIKEAFVAGDISADEMKAIATAIEKLKSVADIDDLRNRLGELEQLLNANR